MELLAEGRGKAARSALEAMSLIHNQHLQLVQSEESLR